MTSHTATIVTGDKYSQQMKHFMFMENHVIVKRRGKVYLCKRTAKPQEWVQCLMVWALSSKLMGAGRLRAVQSGSTSTIYHVQIKKNEWPLRDPLFVIKIFKPKKL